MSTCLSCGPPHVVDDGLPAQIHWMCPAAAKRHLEAEEHFDADSREHPDRYPPVTWDDLGPSDIGPATPKKRPGKLF